jgi:hypothetical protein
MINADADPAFVATDVVDAVRNCLAYFAVDEVMRLDAFRLAFGLPLASTVLVITDQFLLIGIDGDHRLIGGEKCVGLGVDVFELRVAIGVLRALTNLGVGLQAVAKLSQQSAHTGFAHGMPHMLQGLRQFRRALARPAQRRFRVASRQRINQRLEVLGQGQCTATGGLEPSD